MFGTGRRFMKWQSDPVILSQWGVVGRGVQLGLLTQASEDRPTSLQHFGPRCNIWALGKMHQSTVMRKTPFAL